MIGTHATMCQCAECNPDIVAQAISKYKVELTEKFDDWFKNGTECIEDFYPRVINEEEK